MNDRSNPRRRGIAAATTAAWLAAAAAGACLAQAGGGLRPAAPELAPSAVAAPGSSAAPDSSAAPAPTPVSGAPAPAGETLSLRGAAERALGNDHEVAAAAAALQSDLAAVRLSADAFHPEADVSTTPGVGRGLPVAVAGHVPSIVTVDMHQSIHNSEARSQILVARATSSTTRAAYERARLQTTRATIDLYARCWSGQQLLAAAEQRLAAFASMSRRATALHDEGRVTDLDLAQARLHEARARLRRMELASAEDADLWELRHRLGLAAAAPLALPEDLLAELADPTAQRAADVEIARAADPELASTAQSIALLKRARALRDGWFAPVTVDADAQYSRLSRANGIDQFYVKFRADDWSVALAVGIPLWTGGRLRDSLQRTDANLERLNEQQRARADEIERQIHRAESALDQAALALDIARQAAAVAETDLRMANALAAEGRALPDSQETKAAALADAQEQEIQATADLLTARSHLLALRGDLLPTLGVADPPNPTR
jgi:outer membrane protein TolC